MKEETINQIAQWIHRPVYLDTAIFPEDIPEIVNILEEEDVVYVKIRINKKPREQ